MRRGMAGAPRWRPKSSTLRVRVVLYFLGLDLACIVFGFAAAALIRGVVISDPNWLIVVALALPLYVLSALNAHAFSTDKLESPHRAVASAVRSLFIALALVLLMAFALKASADVSRLTFAIGSLISVVTLGVARHQFVRNLHSIIGGDPFSTALIWEQGQPIPSTPFTVVIAADALIDPETENPAMYDRLAKALEGIHNVVVSCAPARRHAWTHALKGANVQSEILMPELDALAPLAANRHGSMTSLVVAHGPLSLVDRVVKRSFDTVFAGGALLVLAPLMITTAIAIKLDSPGPVLFRQKRIGRGNQVFEVMKFRSMNVEQLDGAGDRSAARDDDRITRIGRIIRKTSIDELPQLLNIVRGDMSIVGPRPHALGSRAADKLFWEVDGRYWHRHAAKPGLTGLAQVRGFRGATHQENDLVNRLQADLEYLEDWSIWRDLKIIVMTFQVIMHRNAF